MIFLVGETRRLELKSVEMGMSRWSRIEEGGEEVLHFGHVRFKSSDLQVQRARRQSS